MWQPGKAVWVRCTTTTVFEILYAANVRARAFQLPYFGSGSLPKTSNSPTEQCALDPSIEDPLFAPTAQGLDVTIVSFHPAPYRNQPDGSLSSLIRTDRRKREQYVIPCRAESVNLLLIITDIHRKIGSIIIQALHEFSDFTADCRGKNPSLKSGILRHVSRRFFYSKPRPCWITENCALTISPDLKTGLSSDQPWTLWNRRCLLLLRKWRSYIKSGVLIWFQCNIKGSILSLTCCHQKLSSVN